MSDLSPRRTGSRLSNPPDARPALSTRPTLAHLDAEAKAGRLVFRVFSETSACPLLWTGDHETSGFASLNKHLGSLTPTAYATALASDRGYRSPKKDAKSPAAAVRTKAAMPDRGKPNATKADLPPGLEAASLPARPSESDSLPPRPTLAFGLPPRQDAPDLPSHSVRAEAGLSAWPGDGNSIRQPGSAPASVPAALVDVIPEPANAANAAPRPRRPLPRPPKDALRSRSAATPTPNPKGMPAIPLVPTTTPHVVSLARSPTLIPAPASVPTSNPVPSPVSLLGPASIPSAPWDSWTSGYCLRQTIIDHTNKRTRATFDIPWDEPQVGADGQSPWISASADPQWAVWEVARRLVQVGDESVHLAVIAVLPRTPSSPARGATGEIVLDPYALLGDCKRRNIGTATQGRMTNNEKEAVERSLFSVGTSKEVLFYGRVFAESIVSVLEFTPKVSYGDRSQLTQHLPLELPPHWFAHNRADGDNNDQRGWLDALVWPPGELAFDWSNTRHRLLKAERGGVEPLAVLSPRPRRGTVTANVKTGITGDRGSGPPRPPERFALPPRPVTPPRRMVHVPPRDISLFPRYVSQSARMARGLSDNGWGRQGRRDQRLQ